MIRKPVFASPRWTMPLMRAGTQRLHCNGNRALHLHEGISKQVLAARGCRVQNGFVVDRLDAVRAACAQLPGPPYVIKAQILAGGRGKGVFENGFQGGVHVVSHADEAVEVARRMLHQKLITKQTTSDGLLVSKVLVAECIDIAGEWYISLLLDRSHGGPVLIASKDGGMDIETVAETTPERILRLPVDPVEGLTQVQAAVLATQLGLPAEMADEFRRLYEFMRERDVLMLEVNPLARTTSGEHVIVDAKLQFDDSARFRHSDLWELEDVSQKDPREVEAAKWDLNYVGLQGNVGCLVNGAGLAMATMDIISLHGGSPANFLDVGGSASEAQVAAALRIIQKDPNVKVILVNIFGGIAKCDVIARGVLSACRQLKEEQEQEQKDNIVKGVVVAKRNLPLVVRLSGTNAEQGLILLKESGLPIATAVDLDDAARCAVQLATQSPPISN